LTSECIPAVQAIGAKMGLHFFITEVAIVGVLKTVCAVFDFDCDHFEDVKTERYVDNKFFD